MITSNSLLGIVVVWLLQMNCIRFLTIQLSRQLGSASGMLPCFPWTQTPCHVSLRSLFAQQDHMQVFNFVLDCLDVFHI